MEFEIEMAMLKKRPPLPVPERKKEYAAAAMTMAKIEKIKLPNTKIKLLQQLNEHKEQFNKNQMFAINYKPGQIDRIKRRQGGVPSSAVNRVNHP